MQDPSLDEDMFAVLFTFYLQFHYPSPGLRGAQRVVNLLGSWWRQLPAYRRRYLLKDIRRGDSNFRAFETVVIRLSKALDDNWGVTRSPEPAKVIPLFPRKPPKVA